MKGVTIEQVEEAKLLSKLLGKLLAKLLGKLLGITMDGHVFFFYTKTNCTSWSGSGLVPS